MAKDLKGLASKLVEKMGPPKEVEVKVEKSVLPAPDMPEAEPTGEEEAKDMALEDMFSALKSNDSELFKAALLDLLQITYGAMEK